MSLFRLGLLIPSSNTTMEQEFRLMLPTEISVHVARISLREVVVTELLRMEKDIEEEAKKLADANVNVVGFGCTSGSLVRGLGYDREIVERIVKATKKQAVATAGSVVEALKSLNVSTVCVATPYDKAIDRLEQNFLEENGFSVPKIAGLGLTDNLKIAQLRPEAVLRLAKEVNLPRAEAIFLSCTNMPTIGLIAGLEKRLSKPVVSSNTATLWSMLKKIRYSLKAEEYGKLFARPKM